LLALAALSGLYGVVAVRAGEWPGGGTLIGFSCGVVGAGIILFECFLWFRKNWFRTWRIGRAQTWLRAHIWLGLFTVPLLFCHSGFRLGGTLTTALLTLLLVVVVSGIGGLALQTMLPRRMLEDVPAETIASQIDQQSEQLLKDAEELVLATCGPAAGHVPARGADLGDDGRATFLTIGAVRTAGRVQGKVLQTRTPAEPVAGAEALRGFFIESVAPFLQRGTASGSPVTFRNRAPVLFQELRNRLPAEAHASVDALEGMCDQRRQFELQGRLHFWLHSWLWLHVPLSAALVALTVVHVIFALKFW
jgi:hypothetical protein